MPDIIRPPVELSEKHSSKSQIVGARSKTANKQSQHSVQKQTVPMQNANFQPMLLADRRCENRTDRTMSIYNR